MGKTCQGCGIELQSEDKSKEGYLPEEVLGRNEALKCQRCFKITNYNSYLPMTLGNEDYKREVNRVFDRSDILIAIFDIIDFEGSFADEILDFLREKNTIIVINKIDLIPGEKHPSEVSNWVKNRLNDEGIIPLDIAIVSAKNKYGINGIIRKLRYFLPDGGSVGVIGVTNTGKSSVINGLLKEKRITTSMYPGTTLKALEANIPETKIKILDTPGLIPHGRISDLVCESCNLKIVPSREISRKTFKPKNERVISMGGLLYLKVLKSDDELSPIFSLFASKDVPFHETTEEKLENLWKDRRGELLNPPCPKCLDEYDKLTFKKIEVTINPKEELVFKGLGWLLVKRGVLKVEVYYPEAADIYIREALITPKRT